ncbi:MAG: Hpt domain-containing protein [Lysobacterales bacterium]
MPTLINNIQLDRFRDQPLLLQRLIEIYLDSTPKNICSIEAGIESENLEQIAFHAHSLKGSSVEFGAEHLAELCQQLQAVAEAADMASTEKLVEVLIPCYKETCSELLALEID